MGRASWRLEVYNTEGKITSTRKFSCGGCAKKATLKEKMPAALFYEYNNKPETANEAYKKWKNENAK